MFDNLTYSLARQLNASSAAVTWTLWQPPTGSRIQSVQPLLNVSIVGSSASIATVSPAVPAALATVVVGAFAIISQPLFSARPLPGFATTADDVRAQIRAGVSAILLASNITLGGAPLSFPAGSNMSLSGACNGTCVINAAHLSRHIMLGSAATLQLSGLQLTGGRAGIPSAGDTLADHGGSVTALALSLLVLQNVAFADCSAPGGYGAAVFSLGTVSVDEQSSFENTSTCSAGSWRGSERVPRTNTTR